MISANELNYYKKNGYVVINNFFSKSKIDKIRLEILSLAKKKNNDHFYYENLGKQKVLRRIERISQNSAKMNKILKDIKLKITLKQLTGLKSYLFKDKLNFKFPGAGGFDPHIDGHFLWKNKDNKIKKGWSVYGKKFINVVIPLEKSTIKNGCIYLAKKNDTKSFLGSSWSEISNKLVKFTPKIKSKFLKKVKFRPMILNQGDVMFFDWKVMHHSKKNLSKKSRMIFYATYINSKESKANVIKKYYLDKLKSKNDIKNKSLI
jgi:2-aminoethylphosphonate dioxygenase